MNAWSLLVLFGLIFCTGVVHGQNQPQWVQTLREELHSTGIREDVDTGSEIGVLRAIDADDDEITYSTDSGYFNVDGTSGRVTLALAFDRETNAEVAVTFRASDGKSSPIEVSYTVKILDVNDNSPVFANVPYSTVVREDAFIGAEVFSGISVSDKDSGVNAVIQLSCYVPNDDQEARAACETFKVNQQRVSDGVYTASLALRHTVQHKTKSKYILTLRAVDQGSTPRETIVNVVIDVEDVQDDPPEFLYTPLSMVIYENVDVGSPLMELSARDQDVGNPNALNLSISSDPSNLFSLGESVYRSDGLVTAVVKSKAPIDREEIGSNYEITVQAVEIINGKPSTSNDHKVEATVEVLIRDKNDKSPMFNKQVYDITIDEELARGRSLPELDIIVTDDDLVENAYFELRILNEEARKIFALSPTNGTRSAAVSVVVMEPRFLDYEQPQYRTRVIELMATETRTTEQHSTLARVNIQLRDINDNSPRFAQTSYTTSVMEDRDVGYHIRTITATDADSGVFGQVTYSLVGALSEKFNIVSSTGVITLAQNLDYESENVISLTFVATDGGGRFSSVPFKVNVHDYNDQGPVFDSDHYQTFVDESSTQMSPNVTIHAVDVDSDRDVTYRIQSGNTDDNAFVIGSKDGVFSLSRTVDYRETLNNRGFFSVIVEASDNDLPPVTATTTVVVTVRDENNHSPEFANAAYAGTVTEISPADTSVVQLDASDMDFGNNAKVGYVLHSGGRDNFAIDYYTGLVHVAPLADLDIERFGRLYTMTVYAVDNGSPQRTATAQVKVTVTDSNNQVPEFAQALYRLSILETVPVGTTIQTLTASDLDAGARLEYTIQSETITAKDSNGNPVTSTTPFDYESAFTVGLTSGVIKTASLLSRDQVAEVTFILRANDRNAEQPPVQIGSATVVITIRKDTEGDIVFQLPWTADNPEFNLKVPEEEQTGPSNVILRLVATDPRTAGQLSQFVEVEGSDPNNYFSVDHDTGVIYINRRLDYETMPNKRISFQVVVYSDDTGSDRRSAIAMVIVEVTDTNDHSPQFDEDAYQFDVSEARRYPHSLGDVVANDLDSGSNGNISYSLSGPGANMFIIDPLNGTVMVAPDVTLDREDNYEYTLTVNATDNVNGPGTKRSTFVALVITVEDENDNPPQFDTPEYKANALETIVRDTSLVRVHATDDDAGRNGQIVYTVIDGGEGLFYIQDGTDVVRTKTSLDGHARQTPYVLTVEARDGGVSPLSSTTKVTIFVNTMQTPEGQPRFEFPPEDSYHINVTEGGGAGKNVTQIKAHDGVAGSTGRITYYFFDGNEHVQDVGPFHIDRNTGQITTTRDLDREDKKLYELIVVAEGEGNPPKKTIRTIFINLMDIDDNQPSFTDCPPPQTSYPLEAHVLEGQERNLKVAEVTACDADDPPYNIIYYVITCGNDPDPRWSDRAAFWINSTSGEIWTNVALDRETIDRYSLCVEARSPWVAGNGTDGRRRREAEDGDTIVVNVIVDDIDDNHPSFSQTGATGRAVTAGVLASAPYDSSVVRVYAMDHDQAKYSANLYTLRNIVFFEANSSESEDTPDAFAIDEATGVVTTKLPSYFDFVDGHFRMTVHVTESDGDYPDDAVLVIYVVRSNQRLRFIFDDKPEIVRQPDRGATFVSAIGNHLPPKMKIYADGLHYHIDDDADIDFDKTDLCFHVVSGNEVVNPDEALRIFIAAKVDATIAEIYRNQSVEDVDLCEVKVTTKWWSDYYYLWWILIALALFILIVCLILICCVCCVCCYCFSPKEYPPHKYGPRSIILDPAPPHSSVPIVVNSVGRTEPIDDFEWQEDIVKMD